MKVKEMDASTRVLQLQVGTLMQSTTKLNSSTDRRRVDMHEYFMFTFFLISNLECNQPTLHCSPYHPHPIQTLILPFLKALQPLLVHYETFFKGKFNCHCLSVHGS